MSDEARLPRLEPDEVSGALRHLFDTFLRERGNVPNLFRVAAHRPEIAETLHAHMRSVMSSGEIASLTKELVALRVSHLNGCRY